MKGLVCATSLLLAACRLGGPSADPGQVFEVGDVASAVADGEAGSSGGSSPTEDAGTVVGTTADGAVTIPGDEVDAADEFDASDELDAAAPDASQCNTPLNPLSCDPVHGTGCDFLQQCDIDIDLPSLDARCVFSTPDDAGTCSSTIFSQSCPPPSTCAQGSCHTICLCDADCKSGEYCTPTNGATGFSYCGAGP
jgi:hypothetical protein